MAIPVLDLKAQYREIKDEILAAVHKALEETQFILGPEVKALEENVARYLGTSFGVGVNSGTDALHIALKALNIGAGDEVITTPYTFFATAEVISQTGARPVFVDIEEASFNMDVSQIESRITPKTKAIMPVHLYGQACDMDVIMEIARRHKLSVIEDCAQAMGAEFKGRKVGSFGDAGCLSFFPTKNLGGYGDGGMIVTNRQDVADRARALRAHGSSKKYYHSELGFNSRLDTLQAAVLGVKLRHLDSWNEKRRKNAHLYNESLKDSGVVTPREDSRGRHVYHQYTIRTGNRDALQAALKEAGIGSMIYYPLSLHLQEVYRDLGYKKGDFPVSEKVEKEVLSLPMFPELSEEQIRQISGAIAKFHQVAKV